MSFPINFTRSDEQFIAKVRASKKREMDIARLEISRAWSLWLLWFALISYTTLFILTHVGKPLNIQALYSSLPEAAFLPLCALLPYISVDAQIKTLKLAQRYEQKDEQDQTS